MWKYIFRNVIWNRYLKMFSKRFWTHRVTLPFGMKFSCPIRVFLNFPFSFPQKKERFFQLMIFFPYTYTCVRHIRYVTCTHVFIEMLYGRSKCFITCYAFSLLLTIIIYVCAKERTIMSRVQHISMRYGRVCVIQSIWEQ